MSVGRAMESEPRILEHHFFEFLLAQKMMVPAKIFTHTSNFPPQWQWHELNMRSAISRYCTNIKSKEQEINNIRAVLYHSG